MTIAIVYWSGTGNTRIMAETIRNTLAGNDITVSLRDVSTVQTADILKADALALGCPAMGAEELEESEMEPFVAGLIEQGISGKPMLLFGSYDWGDGEWMRNWEDRMRKAGANILASGLISHNAPDDTTLENLRDAAAKLVESSRI